jgi:hypothetical protein
MDYNIPKTQERRELIGKAFDSMPDNFTSSEFVNKLIEMGVKRERIYLYPYVDTLKNECDRESKKTWTKKKNLILSESKSEYGVLNNIQVSNSDHIWQPKTIGVSTSTPSDPQLNIQGSVRSTQLQIAPNPNLFTLSTGKAYCMIRPETPEGLEEEAIKFLKDKGYKISKTITVEV